MSGLVIGAVVPATPAVIEPIVVNDGWFPDVDAAKLRLERRIRETVTAERLREAILAAMISVEVQLRDWSLRRAVEGRASLTDVPSPRLGGESRLVILYRRAIGALVKADLIEGYRDLDTTGRGDRQVDEMETSVGELRRDATHAIRDILGVTRTTVELI